LQNSFIRHSRLDPESREYLIILDSGFRRNDKIAGFMQSCKGLQMAYEGNKGTGAVRILSWQLVE